MKKALSMSETGSGMSNGMKALRCPSLTKIGKGYFEYITGWW